MKTSLTLFSTLVTLILVELSLARRGGAGRLAQATQCPSTEGLMGACVEECSMTDDTSCSDGNICCSNGCGHTCMAPDKSGRRGQNGCRYSKSKWSDCDENTNTITRTMTLKRGEESACQATKTQTKPCSKRGNKGDQCKYNRAQWSNCDVETDTRTRTLTLKSGDNEACEATKTESQPCKKECKYKQSSVSECTNGKQAITKTLQTGDPANCQPTKILNKKCREGGKKKENRRNKRHRRKDKMFTCQYSLADRSECDEVNKTRTFILTLKRGSRSICEESKSFTRPCRANEDDPNGCSYGKPQVSECIDGKKSITRELLTGDAQLCEPKTTKTKKCGGRKGKKVDKGKGKGKGKKNKNRNKNKD